MQAISFTHRSKNVLGAVLSGLLLAAFVMPGLASAQTDGTGKEEITLSPATKKLSADPGETVSGSFTVLNTGETTFDYTIYARPYSVEDEVYKPNYSDTPVRSNVYRWVQFDVSGGTLRPGENKKINYTIMVPANAEGGGHYSVFFAETVPKDNDEQVVVRNKRVGSVMRLAVSGDSRQAGAVEDQSISWLQFKPPLQAWSRVNNTGNVDFDAQSTMRVSTLFGREVYNHEASFVVYPEKPRKIVLEWENPAIVGIYNVEQSTEVLGDTKTQSRYVVMMPRWMLILIGMMLLAGVAYGAYRRLR